MRFRLCFDEGSGDILHSMSFGSSPDGYIHNLHLDITNSTTNLPVYYVNVIAVNGAGLVSGLLSSR